MDGGVGVRATEILTAAWEIKWTAAWDFRCSIPDDGDGSFLATAAWEGEFHNVGLLGRLGEGARDRTRTFNWEITSTASTDGGVGCRFRRGMPRFRQRRGRGFHVTAARDSEALDGGAGCTRLVF